MHKPLYIFRKLTIAGTPVNAYHIVYSGTQTELRAAMELREYIEKTCAVSLCVYRDTDIEPTEHEILIGSTNRETKDEYARNRENLGEEGFFIREHKGRLFIGGEGSRGTLYGVYEFLEKYVGWRFFASDCECLLSGDTIDIPAGLCDRQVPVVEYRQVHWSDC